MKHFILLLLLLATFCGTAYAQVNDSLIVLFVSEPGLRPPDTSFELLEFSLTRFDANGDKKSDLILRRENEQGELQSLLVRNGAMLDETLLRVQNVPDQVALAESDGMKFYGFADATANGQPEAVFVAEREVEGYYTITLEQIGLSWKIEEGETIRFVGMADLTGDGFDEVIIYLQETQVVKIYTAAEAGVQAR